MCWINRITQGGGERASASYCYMPTWPQPYLIEFCLSRMFSWSNRSCLNASCNWQNLLHAYIVTKNKFFPLTGSWGECIFPEWRGTGFETKTTVQWVRKGFGSNAGGEQTTTTTEKARSSWSTALGRVEVCCFLLICGTFLLLFVRHYLHSSDFPVDLAPTDTMRSQSSASLHRYTQRRHGFEIKFWGGELGKGVFGVTALQSAFNIHLIYNTYSKHLEFNSPMFNADWFATNATLKF